MIFVLNLYNIRPGKEALYREYMKHAGPKLADFNAAPIAAGEHPVELSGNNKRSHMVLVSFPDREAFDDFYQACDEAGLHELREAATDNYLWTLYEAWDLAAWMSIE
ncbi:MAG: DUF1330 domain-containing protein [Pseudomonadota bacterium]